jgi:hypothetical protein
MLLLLLLLLVCLVCLSGGRRGRAGGENDAEAPAGRDEPFHTPCLAGLVWIIDRGARRAAPLVFEPRSNIMVACVADIGRDDRANREEPRKTVRDRHLNKFFPHRRRSGGSVSNAKDGNGSQATGMF